MLERNYLHVCELPDVSPMTCAVLRVYCGLSDRGCIHQLIVDCTGGAPTVPTQSAAAAAAAALYAREAAPPGRSGSGGSLASGGKGKQKQAVPRLGVDSSAGKTLFHNYSALACMSSRCTVKIVSCPVHSFHWLMSSSLQKCYSCAVQMWRQVHTTKRTWQPTTGLAPRA